MSTSSSVNSETEIMWFHQAGLKTVSGVAAFPSEGNINSHLPIPPPFFPNE